MNEYLSFALLCITSFFTLVNPIGTVPVFIAMTAGTEAAVRRTIARKAVLTAFITMVLFAFFGQILFKIFGISVNGLRIVGGVIFFTMGYDMLQAKMSRVKSSPKDMKSYDGAHDISVTPLGIPIICGPGSITNSIVLMEDATSFWMKAILIGSMAAICIFLLLALLASDKIMKVLGETGNRVLSRLMGLIIMVIAVEFFFAGLRPFMIDVLANGLGK